MRAWNSVTLRQCDRVKRVSLLWLLRRFFKAKDGDLLEVGERRCEQPSYWDYEVFNAARQPVAGVTWYEADAYCRWAGKSLPDELQWDKACRGIDGRAFPWGSEPLAGEGNGPSFTLPVGVGDMPQTPSPYGVYDLAGNVLEWSGTANDRGGRVLCGGSGASDSRHVGCGVRSVLLPGVSANFVGFCCQQAAAQ